MIPLNEIRIGIYYSIGFITDKKGKQHHILEKVKNLLDITHAHLSGQGIPLTPEILDKCGFEKDKDGVYNINGYAINKVMYWLDTGHLQIALAYTPILNAPCKYLHQLQNLYFALTGKELNPTF